MSQEVEAMTPGQIVDGIKEAILSLNSEIYGGYDIKPGHANERANNIALWVCGEIEEHSCRADRAEAKLIMLRELVAKHAPALAAVIDL